MSEAQKTKTIIDLIREWPMQRKLSLVGVALLSLVFFGVLISQSRTADYRLLFANLSSTDASRVIERLKEEKVPYRLQEGGSAIFIPADQVYEMRLTLAGSGLPVGGGVGFEIFDRQSFGMTEFAQKVNYRRAMQGELARTIASLAPVETARVHLAIPEKRLFREQQQPTTASVILKLVPGRELNEGQIQGVINLVAGSVEGLEFSNVSVIDASGRVLSRPQREGGDGFLSPGMLEFQHTVERRLEARAQALLDRALGAGNSMVQVTAALDFSQRERMEEIYDPDRTAVRSEQITEEKSGSEFTGGVPGVQSNLYDGAMAGGATPTSRNTETVNFEVSKTVSRMVEPVGSVKSLSVAVLVSDRMVPAAGGGEPTTVPRSAEEVAAIETMVRGALGLDSSRGDQIAVVARPFESYFFGETADAVSHNWIYDLLPFIKYALIALGAILIYVLLVRPMVRTLREEGQKVEHFKTVEELQRELTASRQPLLLGTGTLDESVQRLRQEIMQSKNSPAQVVKSWLKEDQ